METTGLIYGNYMPGAEPPAFALTAAEQFYQDNTHRCAICDENVFRHPVEGFEYDVSDPDAWQWVDTTYFECQDCQRDHAEDLAADGTFEQRKAEHAARTAWMKAITF
jgi:hypothetical protein